MVDWKLRELERMRNQAMAREQQLRDLKEEGEAEHDVNDERHPHVAKRRKPGQ